MRSKWVAIGAVFFVLAVILVGVIVPVLTLPPQEASSKRIPIVSTQYGKYQGSVISLGANSKIIRYAGIPFAQPPVGELRFKPPQPLQLSTTDDQLIDARKLKKSCWSITKNFNSPYYDEDCLYLNVYVPMTDDESPSSQKQNYSTLFWIHGGGFVAGSVFPQPTVFVAKSNVIVVTFNYRLGVFGFLTTGDSTLPANNGLFDQLAALKWVNENIDYFGGNAKSITIAGESAGAISASLHALSPLSSRLFSRVILQSGAASSLLRRNPLHFARSFGNKVGCNLGENTTEFASCLRNVSVKDILSYSKSINTTIAQKQLDFFWLPTVDGQFIIDDPSKLLSNTSYLQSIDAFNKDYLIGFNNNDGSIVVENFLYKHLTDFNYDYTFLSDLLKFLVKMRYGAIPRCLQSKTISTIESFYASDSLATGDNVNKQTIIDIAADSIFFAPMLNLANSISRNHKSTPLVCGTSTPNSKLGTSQISKNFTDEERNDTGKTFVYYFDFCPPRKNKCQESCMIHGSQLTYFFPKKESDNKIIRDLSNKFMTKLSNFVKTGNPGSSWPMYDNTRQQYYNIAPHSSVRSYPFHYRMKLWLEKIPELLER